MRYFRARSRSSFNSRGRHSASISLSVGLFAFTTMYPGPWMFTMRTMRPTSFVISLWTVSATLSFLASRLAYFSATPWPE